MKTVLEYDLDKPEEREQAEAAANGFRYKRTIERFLTDMAGDLKHPTSGVVAKIAIERMSRAAVGSGMPGIRDYAHSLLLKNGVPDAASGH